MSRPFHPLLFAIYPILFLYARNMDEFPLAVLLGPIIVSLAITCLLLLFLRKFTINLARSAFLLSLFLMLFFSYGHFYHLLEDANLLNFELLGDQKGVLTIYGIAFVLLSVISYKAIQDWKAATQFANVFAIALIFFALLNIGRQSIRASGPVSNLNEVIGEQTTSNPDAPDIFYIILDGYPRQDVLQQLHHFDNSEFISFLTENGFCVLPDSHSNYPGTSLSLASSLNYQYLDSFIPKDHHDSSNRWLLTKLIQNNRVLEFLKEHGYKTAAFDSGYFSTELKTVDQFFATGWFLNEFHDALLDTTPAWVLFKNLGRYEMQRKRILYILDHLPDAKDRYQPVFVFAHIMALHPPFVFGPNGEERNVRESSLKFWQDFGEPSRVELSKQYTDQLTFVNKKVKQTITHILGDRKRPVLIILQGDHGSSFLKQNEQGFYKERFSILNAIHFDQGRFHPSITPVNTFRVIFNSLFQTKLQLLPDRSFYSVRDKPYNLQEVTDKLVEPEINTDKHR
jgi:Sulfatase